MNVINQGFPHGMLRRLAAIVWIMLFSTSAVTSSVARGQPPITALSYSPDGSQIIIGSQSGIQIFQADQTQVGVIETDMEFVNELAFSKDGSKLAIAGGSPSESGSIEIFDWPGKLRQLRKQISDDVLYSVDWSRDGKFLAVAGHDTSCQLLDLETKQICDRWSEHSRPVRSIRFLADPHALVSASADQTIRVWEMDRIKALRSLNNHTAEIHAIAVAPVKNESQLTMIVSVGQDKTVRFWQPAIGRMIRFARIGSNPLSVQWDTDGHSVVVGCEDGKIYSIDSRNVAITGKKQVLDGPIYCIARHPKRNAFAIGGFKNRWRVLTLDSLQNGIAE